MVSYYAKTVLKNTLKKIIFFKKKHNMNILGEYTEYKETENNDNKIVDNLSEE